MEQLTDWLKRIREVGYADKGKKRLRIGYDDGGEDKLVIKGKKGKRYVEVEKEVKPFFRRVVDFDGKYRLIEGQPKLGESDFQYCIFLVELKFGKGKFENNVDFIGSVFTQNVNFEECNFKKAIYFNEVVFKKWTNFRKAHFQGVADFSGVHFQGVADFMETHFQGVANFWRAHFQGGANFRKTYFQGEANFWRVHFQGNTVFCQAHFQGGADFWKANFEEEANFWKANFEEEANFGETNFQGKAAFRGSHFQGEVNFGEANFQGKVDFSKSKIKSLIFSSVQEEGKFSLYLKSAQIEAIDYTDTEFSEAENRDTYLVLKNLALKQNDQIRALDFYQKEMAQHWKDLKFFKHPIDKTILFFEKYASQYGTNPLLAAGWLILVNMILVITSQYDIAIFEQSWVFRLEHLSWAWDHAVLMKPFIKFLTLRSEEYNLRHLASLILNPFLIYEIVKSLRKFSRKL